MTTRVQNRAASMRVEPSETITGELRVPGDKSIAHRTAMLCGLAGGESILQGYPHSEDCLHTLHAVEALGAETDVADAVTIRGVGGHYRQASEPLDLGNSGTGLRLLSGILAGHAHTTELTGDDSLRARPMSRIRDPLERMGAQVELLGEGNTAPLRVTGGALQSIHFDMPVASAQVKSCVLLAGMFADGDTSVREPHATRDHTERLLNRMGCAVQVDQDLVTITGNAAALNPQLLTIPGDFSSAAVWITIAAATPGARVHLRDVGLNPRRTALLDVLRRMGAKIDVACSGEEWEPVGDIDVEGCRLTGTETGGAEIPNVIDELPLVAVAGALAEGQTRIRDAAELRVKETDRIAAMATNLGAVGVRVEVSDDGLLVEGSAVINGGATVESFGDHRIAMAMAALALRARAEIVINNVDCVATSYPGFWSDLEKVTQNG